MSSLTLGVPGHKPMISHLAVVPGGLHRASTVVSKAGTTNVVGFVTTSVEGDNIAAQQQKQRHQVQTMKEKMMATISFKQFQSAINAKVGYTPAYESST